MPHITTFRTATLVSLAVGLLIAVAARARAQETAAPRPSAEHQVLARDVGTWDAVVRFWPTPDAAQPIESKAVEKNELLPGGMWLVSRFDGDFGGAKFTGVGNFGYDPVEKKYIGTWVDSMTPHLMITKADYDPATKTMTGTGETRDPATGQPSTIKNVSRYLDDDTRVFTMYMPDASGKEFKAMEITYKRRPQ